ncbi:MAG: 5-deoxy-glucuronate isomerase [Armatimonadota bacterium]|nr:5-deoxy-glucuronate isomerase [Armatimonadota bacterium]MDR7428317.1 5-deoxy-glucuronate isomerase [Armatimonadota bacterium]MDR7463404.1 5-deoxy-glucuronate isomerase [Armatimonadota bacterium]MDR7470225.1 5-deoxy-glucuronate isomerase [Armatimonadota bacterium]MDR7475577.1 5-deoxy-glucuronate isomerase [Armatimonadota bacterium]
MDGLPQSQLIPAAAELPGIRPVARPPGSPLRFLEFALVTLGPGEDSLAWISGDREAVLYLIGGACRYAVSGAGSLEGVLDSRPALFEGPPSALYLPPGARLRLTGQDGARLALFTAPPVADRPPRAVLPDEVSERSVGREAWARTVRSVIDQRTASRLLVGETINRPGAWSSYPPHKHDVHVPGREVPMEEVYHFFVRPPGGFGLQMVYTAPDVPDPFEHIYRVRQGDTVVIPRGYHPVVAAGGYHLAYLWAISGERVDYGAWNNDPAHAWLVG